MKPMPSWFIPRIHGKAIVVEFRDVDWQQEKVCEEFGL